MKDKARIEVHFEANGKEHTIVLGKGTPVESITLKPPRPPTDPIPNELKTEELSTLGPNDGPGVCYEINGTQHCW